MRDDPPRAGKMVTVQCSRAGCETTAELHPSGLTIIIPKGWHHHVDNRGKVIFACSDLCFDVWWRQRCWRMGKRAMMELEVAEEKLLPQK